MMKIFYFTGTGNSLYVAQQLGGELLSIPQVMKDDRIEIQDEAVGIVCPIYAGDMPKMVHRFLEKAKIEFREIPTYDYLVINDKVSNAVEEIEAILVANECRVDNRRNILKGEFSL
mgnify:CR=1 FL=1